MEDFNFGDFFSSIGDSIIGSIGQGIEAISNSIASLTKSIGFGFEDLSDYATKGYETLFGTGDQTEKSISYEDGSETTMYGEDEGLIGSAIQGGKDLFNSGVDVVKEYGAWAKENPEAAKVVSGIGSGLVGAYNRYQAREDFKEMTERKLQAESQLLRDRYNYDYQNTINKRKNAFSANGA